MYYSIALLYRSSCSGSLLLPQQQQHGNYSCVTTTAVASGQTQVVTKHDYLHEGGWKDPSLFHHKQPWVKSEMKKFHEHVNKWEQRMCIVCHEIWPTKPTPDPSSCTRCKRDKHNPKLFSSENCMDPGRVPPCLQGLSQIEEMLIARANPIMCLYRKHGGQHGYRGHVLNVAQDIQGFLDQLPANVNEIPILFVRRAGDSNTHIDLRVRRGRVLTAILWLQQNNPFYADISISVANLNALPHDGVPDNLQSVSNHAPDTLSHDDEHPLLADDQPDDITDCSSLDNPNSQHGDTPNANSTSFLPLPSRGATEAEAIRSTIDGTDPLEWPNADNTTLINEFKTAGLATMAFPTLFPYGKGDPTCPSRQHPVTLTEAFKHLNHYAEVVDGVNHWRFASHPRFPYWSLNMKIRHQLISQSNVYIRQHPADAELTVEDLHDMVGTLDTEHLMNCIQRYATKVQGTSQFWYQKHQELRALLDQKGPPTFFWTVSSADMHWPKLHDLMPSQGGTESTIQSRAQAVIGNPHLTDWFFSSKLNKRGRKLVVQLTRCRMALVPNRVPSTWEYPCTRLCQTQK